MDLLWDFGTPIPMSVRDSSLATGSPSKEPKDESCCGVVNENVCGPQCISLVACTQLGITTDKAKGAWVVFFLLFLTFEKFKYLPLPYCFVDFWCLTPESVIVPTSFGAVPFDRWPWHFVL